MGVHLLQAASLIGNGDAYSFFFGQQFGGNGDSRILRAVFQCIDKQIAQDDFTLGPYRNSRFRCVGRAGNEYVYFSLLLR